jgi:hypothetical protein
MVVWVIVGGLVLLGVGAGLTVWRSRADRATDARSAATQAAVDERLAGPVADPVWPDPWTRGRGPGPAPRSWAPDPPVRRTAVAHQTRESDLDALLFAASDDWAAPARRAAADEAREQGSGAHHAPDPAPAHHAPSVDVGHHHAPVDVGHHHAPVQPDPGYSGGGFDGGAAFGHHG